MIVLSQMSSVRVKQLFILLNLGSQSHSKPPKKKKTENQITRQDGCRSGTGTGKSTVPKYSSYL